MKNNELKEIWNKVLENIEISEQKKFSFNMIVSDSQIKTIDEKNGSVILTVRNEFTKTILIEEFFLPLSETINKIMNSNFNIIILTDEEFSFKNKQNNIVDIKKEEEVLDEFGVLNPKYTLEDFVASESNKMLYTAAMSVSIKPGNSAWNPFFIYGASGLGKTHLLHSIGNHSKKRNTNIRIKYIEAKDIGKVIHEAMKDRGNIISNLEEVKDKFLKFDILLIDDIQFIQSWTKAKEIFFAIFNSFINSGKQVVITSDQYPEEMKEFEERFVSRFKGGLWIGVVPPDVETAKEIVKLKLVKNHNYNEKLIDEEAIEFVAMNFASNVRELEGAVNRIIFWTINSDDEQITLASVSKIFKGMLNKSHGVTIKRIISTVAKYYNISSKEIISSSRKTEIMLARHLSIYFARTLLDLSLMDIGREFGKNHSTIVSSIKKIEKEKEAKKELNMVLYELRKKITKK